MAPATTYPLFEKEGAQPVTYPDAAHRQSELPRKIIPGEQDQHQSSAHGLGKQDDHELANIKDRLASEKQRIGKEGSVVDSGTQQTANTMPDASGPTSEDVVPSVPDGVPRGVDADTGNELSFKDKVKGYAKLNAGSITHNSKEKAQGEALLRGEDIGQKH